MEVSGKHTDAVGSVCDAPVCQPCADAGNRVTAVKFCSVCKEWLCQACTEYHRRLKATRNHLLLDIDTASEVQPGCDIEHQNAFHYCDNHPSELLRYICPTHNSLHCGDCIALIKSSCKMVKVSNISKNVQNKVEFTELLSQIEELLKSINALESNIYSMKESVLKMRPAT